MNQFLPYNVLLVIAVITTGCMAFYNFALRDSFPVMISYTMPAAPKLQEHSDTAPPSASDDGVEFSVGESMLESVTFPLDLNLATEEQLMFIPQVGSVTAQRIVQYRDVLGGYTSLEQLKEIKGIGDSSFEKISAYLIITNEDADDSADTDNNKDD